MLNHLGYMDNGMRDGRITYATPILPWGKLLCFLNIFKVILDHRSKDGRRTEYII